MRLPTLLLLLFLWAPLEAAAQASFSKKPEAIREGERTKIVFVLKEPGDVEVAVLAADGSVVCHLAAGVLGAKLPPPEPLKSGLSQTFYWDGRDDHGNPAAGGPFRVRVRAGLKPEFDGFLLYNPEGCGPIEALAVGPGGSVYLFHHDPTALPMNWGSKKIKIIDREGHHVRAIAPYPADMAPEKIKALAPFQDDQGALVPHIHYLRHLSFYPAPGSDMGLHSCPTVNSKGRIYWMVKGPALCALDADGSVPFESFVGPKLLPQIKNLRMASMYLYYLDTPALALSSDEKFIYFAGLSVGEFGKDALHKPVPCVFRVDTATRGPGEVFLGKPDEPGTERERLSAPRGIAVANGSIYVADPAAHRIAIFKESDRSFAGEIKVQNPQTVGVDPATGAVYVCAYTGKQTADLIKFEGPATGKELYRLTLPKTGLIPNTGVHRVMVDASTRPVRLWLPDLPYSPSRLKCIDDAGDKFVDRGDPRDLKEPWAEGPRDLTLDRLRGELYVKTSHQMWFRIEEKTGKTLDKVDLNKIYKYGLNMSNKGTQLVPSPDGSLVTLNWNEGLIRLDRSGKPLNWPGRDTDRIPYGGIMSFMERTMAIPRQDEIFVILPNTYRIPDKTQKPPHSLCSVDVLGTDGATKRTVVWQCTHGAILRVDHRGNIYLGEPIKPIGRSNPEFFDGKVAPQTRGLTPEEGKDVFWYSYAYGSIVKFPPSGGALWYDKEKRLSPSALGRPPADLLAKPVQKAQAHLVYTPNAPVEIQGAEWARFGFAPFTMHSGSDTCMCEGAGFDVDLYGRVFYPNLGQFRIEAVDGSSNLIGTFGKYGNQDSGGPGGRVRKPEIPLAWPLTVAVSDTHAYVADTLNRRVVKVRLGYAAEEILEAK